MDKLVKRDAALPGPVREETLTRYSASQVEQGADLRAVGMTLWKWKWLILGTAVLAMVPTAVMDYLATPLYQATASIRIDPETTQVLPYKEVTDSLASAPSGYELYIKTQDQILRSSTLAAQTILRLRAQGYADQLDQLSAPFARALSFERIEGTQVIRISLLAPDSDFAATAVNAFTEEFIRLHFETKLQTNEKAKDFLQEQLVTLRSKVEEAERELVDYARVHDMLTHEDSTPVIEQRFGVLTQELSKVEADYFGKRAKLESLREASVEQFPESLRSQFLTSLEARLAEKEQELTTLLTTFGENWPEVIKKRQELVLVEQQLKNEKQTAIDQAILQAELEYSSSQREYRLLSGALNRQRDLVTKLNEDSIQYNILKREVETNKELYEGLLQRLKQTGVSTGLEFGNIHVLDPASPSQNIYSPRLVRDLAVSGLLGLGIGIALAFLLNYLDSSVRVPEDMEGLGLPSLGVIPAAAGLNGSGGSLVYPKLLPANPSSKSSNGRKLKGSLHWPEWQVRESYHRLCTSIMLARGTSPATRILVTSSIPQEGKTTTVSSLGMTLAEMGARTLLIDADFRKSVLASRVGVAEQGWLSVFLAGHRDFDTSLMCKTELDGLWVMPSGPRAPNPIALLGSPHFDRMLSKVTEEFDFVLIDSPPILTVADARVIAQKVDGVVLVVRAGKTSSRLVDRSRGELENSGACILGGLINRADLGQPEYYYFNRYYFDAEYASADAVTEKG